VTALGANIFGGSCVYTSVTEDALTVAAPERCESEARELGLSRLFEAHHQRLYRLARRLVATGDEARDLVQDTFLRAAQTWRTLPASVANEEAWLVRVLVNLCRDRWRRRAIRRRFMAEHRHATRSAAPDAERALIAQDTLWRALHGLPPRRRAVIVLHELEDIDIKDVSRLLGISVATVRWHLSLGRRALERMITNES